MALAFKDWKVWTIYVWQFGADVVLYCYGAFLAASIKSLGTWTMA